MRVTVEHLRQITGTTKFAARKATFIDVLGKYSPDMLIPHRFAMVGSQVLLECNAFRYGEEIWGPTAQQRKYEPPHRLALRLGNTQKGDGKRFKGHGELQVTGRENHRKMTQWLRKHVDSNLPDFEAHPDQVANFIGLPTVWYFATRVSSKHIESGNIEMVTQQVNGGHNGLGERIEWFNKIALVLLGFGRNDVRGFQTRVGLEADGVAGPVTRKALFSGLKKLSGASAPKPATPRLQLTEPVSKPLSDRPALRVGDRGMFVQDLQTQLNSLKFFVGAADGVFGEMTTTAVFRFQRANGLAADGVVGGDTWAALLKAKPAEREQLTHEQLLERGSGTLKRGEQTKAALRFTGLLGSAASVNMAAQDAQASLLSAQGLLDTATMMATKYWPLLLIGAAGMLAVWWFNHQTEKDRLQKHNIGADIGR